MFSFGKKSAGGYEFLIVGLGNPGKKYEFTRHNAGFLFTQVMEDTFRFSMKQLKYSSVCGQCEINGHRCVVIRPQTMMNLSGQAVRQAADFYKIPVQNIIVIFDDISLPVGKLRIRRNGSAGGHNGIKSIIEHLGSSDFPRIKLGIGNKPDPDYELADWVLSRFTDGELKDLRTAVDKGMEGLKSMLENEIEKAMNLCN